MDEDIVSRMCERHLEVSQRCPLLACSGHPSSFLLDARLGACHLSFDHAGHRWSLFKRMLIGEVLVNHVVQSSTIDDL